MRYKYLAYKYTRRTSAENSFHAVWGSFGAWAHPSALLWRPPTDVYETRDKLIIAMELGGVEEDDITITLFSDLLVVEGRRQQTISTETNACHQLGIKYGDFKSEVRIPFPVDSERVKADYKNGLLTVTLSKIL